METICVFFRRIIIFLLVVLLVHSLFAQLTPEEKQRINVLAKNLKDSVKILPDHEKKISSLILQNINQMEKEGAKELINSPEIVHRFSTPALRVDERGRLDVYLVLSDESGKLETEKVIDIIKQQNGIIKSHSVPKPESKWMPEIYCWIPFEKIKELAKLKDVKSILPSPIRVSRIGEYLTEGFSQLKANLAQQHYSVTGEGVKIGVISTGVQHWDISYQSGDLPNDIHHNNCPVPDDEGTAMLEIVYDMAEGADLYFRGIATDDEPTDMSDRILELQGAGCRVIVDDIGWLGVPFFQDNDELCQTVRAVIVDDRTYISAAGNDAENLWGGYFEGDPGYWLLFDGENIGNKVTIENGDKIRVELQWANDWNDASDDYDLFLYNWNNTTVVASGNQTSNTPQEILQYTNNTGLTDDFYIRVQKSSGYDVELKILGNIYDSNNNRKPCTFDIKYPSGYDHPVNQIYGHTAVQDVISVAAYSAFKLNKLEPYSSRGPTNIYLSFNPVSLVTRETPTITATDSVETKIGSTQYWPELFPGTSAAAPHVAGIAALYYEKYPNNDPEDFLSDLTSGAESFGNYGNPGEHNTQSGYGRADALEALGGISGIEVQQLNQAGSNTGEFEHWGGSEWEPPYTAPHTFDWQSGTDQTLRAEQDVWYGEKFQYWNEEDSILNHDTFPISNETDLLFAQLNRISETTVKTYLISASGIDPAEDSIDFKDPWLIDYSDPPYGMRNRGMAAQLKTYPSPLNLTTGSDFKGVFLNQNETFDPNLPIYSVGAENPQTIPFHGQDITWYFQWWSGMDVQFQNSNENETAVVFQQADAVVKANYKGHLASATYEATSTNNGRRITYDAEGNLHCVYLDADNIWYTYSDDGGETWTPEEFVDGAGTSPGVQCFNPSITVLNGKIYCIYTTFWDVEGFTYFELRYSYKTIGLANWTAVVLEYIYDSVNNKPNPVISAGYYNENKYLIFTYTVVNEQTEEFEIHTQYKKNNDSFVHIEQNFPGTMPSTDNNKGISVTNFFLAYEYHGDIYTRFWDWSRKEWTEEACASSDLWMLTNTGQPSLSAQGDYGYLVFEGVTEANPTNCVYCRKIKYKSWTGFRFYDPYLISENSVHPTVSYNTTPVVTVFYQHDGKIYNKHNEEGVWHLGPYGPGRNPNVTVNGIARACWTKEESLPYLVVTAGDEVGGGGGSEDGGKDTLKVDKQLSFVFQNDKRNSYLALDIRNMTYNGKYIQFDSLLSSPVFSLSSAGGALNFEIGYMTKNFTTGINLDEEIFRITLQNGLSVYLVRSFKLRDILNLQLMPGQTNTISINIPSLTASTGRFVLSFTNLKPNVIHLVGSPVSSVNNEMLVSQNINQTITLPEEFFLEQNWPNPFNPNTNIRFSLPEEFGVSLVIYDLNGRQIKTLTSSRYPAGSHQVQWDGRDDSGNAVASGIYIYRIEAGKYTQSRKMILLK